MTPLLNTQSFVVGTWIDILIAVLVLLNVIRGRKIGTAPLVLSDLGFFAGMFLGVQLVPFTVLAGPGPVGRVIVTFATILAVGLFVGFAGFNLGLEATKRIRWPKLRYGDAMVGGVLCGATCIIQVWFISGIFLASPVHWLAAGLERSVAIRVLDAVAPPVPDVVTHIQSFIDPNGSPQVFVDLEPIPRPPVTVADAALVERAVAKGGGSTVRVNGFSCGGLVSGSGFVAAPGEVMTAAHVVAGLRYPFVTDQAGVHPVTVVWFDSATDVAVLRSSDLKARPLALAADDEPDGTEAVALVYPAGGQFAAEPAGIMGTDLITGHDIYGRGVVSRPIYTLEAQIVSGDSGGPVVLADGTVAGMVIARSQISDSIGYALTAKVLAPVIKRAALLTRTVSSGTCTGK